MKSFRTQHLLAKTICALFLFLFSNEVLAQDEFITTWKLIGDLTITVPLNPAYAADYDFNINWGDGTIEAIGANTTATHDYSTSGAGVYTIEITGDFPSFYTNISDTQTKLKTVEQWGDISWKTMKLAFRGVEDLTFNAIDAPDLSLVSNMDLMFYQAPSFNSPIDNWNTSQITSMSNMFGEAILFNQNINNWDVSNVKNFYSMFRNAKSFNQPLNQWNTLNVLNMGQMFDGASSFNQDLDEWKTDNATSLVAMFRNAAIFNGDITNWDVSKNKVFNSMFAGASNFNQPIGDWVTIAGNNMRGMFTGATNFNQPIGNWNTTLVKNMASMFYKATNFNQPIGNWNTTLVKDMSRMFQDASNFNQAIGDWNTEEVVSMSFMFSRATGFNQPLGGWNTSKVTRMANTFNNATSFNYPIDNWNVSLVTNMSNMLDNSGISLENYDNILIGWASQANVPANITLGALGLEFCGSSLVRDELIQEGWTFVGDARACFLAFTSEPVVSANDNEAYTYEVTTSDEYGAVLQAITLPEWMAFTDGVLSGTPNGVNLGDFVVTLSADNGNGNPVTQSFTVNVADVTAPVINALAATSLSLSANGLTILSVTDLELGTTDNSGNVSLSLSQSSFDCSQLGTNLVDFIAIDPSGNQSTIQVQVEVVDAIAPTVIGKPITVTLTANGTVSISPPDVLVSGVDNCGSIVYTLSQDTFGTQSAIDSPVTIQLMGTDPSGNATSVPVEVTVIDPVPVVVTQNITVALGADGIANILPVQVDNGSSSVVGLSRLSLDISTFDCSNVGVPVTVTLTATSTLGSTASGIALVTIVDTDAPLITLIGADETIDVGGVYTESGATVTDNCSDLAATIGGDAVNTGLVGTYTVTYDAQDASVNNAVQLTRTVTVQDVTVPALTVTDILVNNDAGVCGAAIASFGASAIDASGTPIITFDISEGTVFSVGTTTVTATAIDINNLSSTATFNVTVNDAEAPLITLIGADETIDVGGVYTESGATVTDNCNELTATIGGDAVNTGLVGTYTVTYDAQDASGNNAVQLTRTVTVQDVTAPALTVTDILVNNDAGVCGAAIASFAASATDASGTPIITFDVSEGTLFTVGTTTVTATATDINNLSSTATFNVTVNDAEAPTVFTQDITVALDENGAYTITASDIDAGSFDNCTFDLTIDNNAFNCTTLGENIVNLTATDASGNATTVAATVTVIDNAAPTIVATNIVVELDENGSASITVSDVDGGTYDNCAVASVTIDVNSFDCNNLGENIVTLTATDVNGNVSSGPAVVTVVDVIAPTVGVQSISVDLDANGVASISPEDVLLYSESDVLRDTECDLRSSTLKYVMKLKGDKDSNGYSKGKKDDNKGKGKYDDDDDDEKKGKGKKDDDDDDDKGKGDDDDDDHGDDDDDHGDKDSQYAQYVFDGTGGKILKRLDGSLSVSGVLVNQNDPSDSYELALELIGAYDYATWSSMDRKAKEVKYETYHLNWTYYTISSGSLTGAGINAGTTVDLKDYSYKEGFQLGDWANGENGDEGLRGKFKGISDDDFKGELKLDVFNCDLLPVPAGTVYTSDNCSIVDFSFDQDTFSCDDLTETTVMLTATDQSGNATTVPVSVTVNDRIAPVAIAQNITVSLGANGSIVVDPILLGYESTDNTDCALTFTLDRDTFDCDDIGKGSYYYDDHSCSDDRHKHKKGKGHNYGDDDDDNDPGKGKGYGHKKGFKKKGHRVTLTVTDAAGNSSTATAYISVVDEIAPVISSEAITVVVYDKKKAYLTKKDVELAVTDNCKVKYISFARTKYDRNDAGMNTVAVSATDYSGNEASGNITVNVVDISSYGKYVTMCYEGRARRVKQKQVQNYLRRGAVLGSCSSGISEVASEDDVITDIEELPNFVPEIRLINYPNPTSGYTVFTFSSDVDGPARLAIMNTNGVQLATLFNDDLVANEEVEVGYEAGALPSGIYIVRLVTGGTIKNIKLMVKK